MTKLLGKVNAEGIFFLPAFGRVGMLGGAGSPPPASKTSMVLELLYRADSTHVLPDVFMQDSKITGAYISTTNSIFN